MLFSAQMKRIFSLLYRHRLALAILLVTCLRHLFHDLFSVNEQDVLPCARQFVDSNYIPGDWYLNQEIGYRKLFYAFVGWGTVLMGFPLTALTGRFLSYLLFSFILEKLILRYGIKLAALIPFLLIFFSNQGLFAQEWMIGGLETKSFAYLFSLLSFVLILDKKYTIALASAGLALSFHILVGLYGAFCLFTAILFSFNEWKASWKRVGLGAVLFLICSSVGLSAVLGYVQESASVDSEKAAVIYAQMRVPHHTMPFGLGIGNLIPFVAGLIFSAGSLLFAFKSKSYKWTFTAAYAAAVFVLFTSGAFILLLGKASFAKYYLFRFPDTIIPFMLYLSAAYGVSRLVKKDPTIRIVNHKLGVLNTVLILISLSAISYYTLVFSEDVHRTVSKPFPDSLPLSADLHEVCAWIRKNTSKEDVFLTSPFMDRFYLAAQRPILVSEKHSPQSDPHIIEWYNRIRLCNGGEEMETRRIDDQKSAIENKFYSLPDTLVKRIAATYDIRYYLSKPGHEHGFRPVFSNSSFILFDLN